MQITPTTYFGANSKFTFPTLATGGEIVTYYSGSKFYRSHTFKSGSSGAFNVVTASISNTQILVIGGGGSGGYPAPCAGNDNTYNNGTGGGGAGGFVYSSSLNLISGSYTASIGAGATTASSYGGDTIFSTSSISGSLSWLPITAFGGGQGGAQTDKAVTGGGQQGFVFTGVNYRAGSGGGSVGTAGNPTPTYRSGGTTGSLFSNLGQGKFGGGSGWWVAGGGGGGASTAGTDASGYTVFPENVYAGDGGSGSLSTIQNGNIQYYAGGGGGGTFYSSPSTSYGKGGIGGGGNGGVPGNRLTATGSNGTPHTGGGGGGASGFGGSKDCIPGIAGTGGSGIIIIAYEITPILN